MGDETKLHDSDGNPYVFDSSFGAPTYVSPGGSRYFLHLQNDQDQPPARYREAPQSELDAAFASKSTVSSQRFGEIRVDSVSFQAYKTQNEDRVFVFPFSKGLLFGVLDGHAGNQLVEHVVQEFPPFLAQALESALEKSPVGAYHQPSVVSDVLEAAFLSFDASILSAVTTLLPPDREWTAEEVRAILRPENGDQTALSILRRAGVGTTALVGFISDDHQHLWVAGCGDSIAFAGRLISTGEWGTTILSESHNSHNPVEVAQVQAAHPGEESKLFEGNYFLSTVAVTRAFGDFWLKIDHQYMRDVFIRGGNLPFPPPLLATWYEDHPTPPYMTSKPDVFYYTLQKGDVIVLASDGLENALQLKHFPRQAKGPLFVALAGSVPQELLEEEEKVVGHKFIEPQDGDNSAERVLKNVLHGKDTRLLAREVNLEGISRLQDDITVLTVHV